MSVQEMRAELKVLRSEHPDFKPVSKMKKADISSLLEKMKQHTETTPAIALTKGEPMTPAKGEILNVKGVSESKVRPLKETKKPTEKPTGTKKPTEKPTEKPMEAKKETIKDRMARIRAMRKKKE
jgi:hypothetical protein